MTELVVEEEVEGRRVLERCAAGDGGNGVEGEAEIER